MATTSIDIEPNDRRDSYVASSGQTVFDYTFPIYDTDEITVAQNGTILTLTSDYTVQDAGEEAGGTITLVTGATLDDEIVIFGSAMVERQDQNFQQAGDFYSTDLNRQLNKLTIFQQEATTKIDRKIGLADTTVYDGSLDFPGADAGKAILWNDTADGLVNSTDNFDDIVTEATAAKDIAVASAAAAAISATNAATSETNAATSEANAAASEANAAASALAAEVAKIEWQGSWSAGTYNQSDAVEHNGSSWIVNTTSTTEEPSITATDWDLLALKGTDGTGTIVSVNGDSGPDVVLDTDDISEGTTNLYDKTVSLTAGTAISVTGTYPNFTIASTASSDYPAGYINGGKPTYNSASLLDITALKARSSDDLVDFNLSATSLDITSASDWADGVARGFANEVPTMTSNTAPSGVASASSQYDANRAPFKAFDGNDGSSWAANTNTGWLQYQFTSSKKIVSYFIQGSPIVAAQSPNSWTIEASNTGAFSGEEVTLDTITGQTSWTSNERRYFEFTNTTSYLYYRINITSNNGEPYASISKFELSETIGLPNTTLHIFADNNGGSQQFILDTMTDGVPDNITDSYKRAGSFITDSSGNIIPFRISELAGGGIECNLGYISDIDQVSTSSSAVSYPISVPYGINVTIIFNVLLYFAGLSYIYMSGDDGLESYVAGINNQAIVENRQFMKTSTSQINIRTTAIGTQIKFDVNGYVDERID